MNKATERCRGLAGMVFGHRFVPVYDTHEKLPSGEVKMSGEDARMIDLIKEKSCTLKMVYCARCGQREEVK